KDAINKPWSLKQIKSSKRAICTCKAIKISDHINSVPKLNNNPSNSTQNSITCIYKLSILKQELLITVTWTKKLIHQGFIINIDSDSNFVNVISRNRGVETFQFQSFKVKLIWDLSTAKYDEGSEPINGFYIVVFVNSELGHFLGDKDELSLQEKKTHGAKISMVSRSERFSGTSVYAIKAKFSERGILHIDKVRCIRWIKE
ncbi:hypothetical protein RYX36_030362, partial [Vicia faba]